MKLLKLKSGQTYFITEEEAGKIAEKISQKGVAFLKRLENLMVSEFLIDYFGPVNESFVGKQVYADANGILYYHDGENWYFWHRLPSIEKFKTFGERVESETWVLNSNIKRVEVEKEMISELQNRFWVKVADHDEMAVVPVDEYLTIKFTNNALLESIMDAKILCDRNLPTVITSELKLIGTDKRLAREEVKRKWHIEKIQEFKEKSLDEKIEAYHELRDKKELIKEFAKEFEDLFFAEYQENIENCETTRARSWILANPEAVFAKPKRLSEEI